VFRFLGGAWKAERSGTDLRINDVVGTSSGDLFAVGMFGTILHRRVRSR
jgi:hypothetical protein